MKYAVIWASFGLVAILLAFQHRGAAWILLWPGMSFLLVAMAYAGAGPSVFGKRQDGTLRPLRTVLLLPYLLLTWAVWNAARLLSKEPAWSQLCDGVLVGRRLLARELPASVVAVLDLTSEFAEPPAIVRRVRYYSYPILDACHLPTEQLRLLVQEVKAEGSLYIHCAQGHGRTGMVAAIFLLARKRAQDADDAIRLVRQARPGVSFSACQEAAIRSFEKAPEGGAFPR